MGGNYISIPKLQWYNVAVWGWISNFIPHFTGRVINYSYWDQSWCMLVTGAPVEIYLTAALFDEYHTWISASNCERGRFTKWPHPGVSSLLCGCILDSMQYENNLLCFVIFIIAGNVVNIAFHQAIDIYCCVQWKRAYYTRWFAQIPSQ